MSAVTQIAETASAPAAAIDIEQVRAQFPILQEQVYGRQLVYLDSAASSQKPLAVQQALKQYYSERHANVHRGVHALSDRATQSYETAREQVRQFVNAAESKEIIFVRGTTEAINLAASSYGRSMLGADSEILISEMEHHSNIVPWQLIAEQAGCTVRKIPMDDEGQLVTAEYDRLLNSKTAVVALSYVANSLGTVNPVASMIRKAHDVGAVVMVDAAQAVPHLALDVQQLDCDFLAFSGHKMYGPTGIGVLYGKRHLLEAMPPYQGGGEMIRRVTFEGSEYAQIPHKFEAGTPNIADAVGLGAAIEFMWELGISNIAAHEDELLAQAHRRAAEHDDIRIYGNAPHKSGVFAFGIDGIHPHDLGTIVDREGIAIRVGHHCAMPVMQYFGVAATARASFGVYNTLAEVDFLFDSLDRARELFAR